jgi:hypothetical protein
VTTSAPLFDRYAVDPVINGHIHGYERADPIRAVASTAALPGLVNAPRRTTSNVAVDGPRVHWLDRFTLTRKAG